MSNQGIGRVSNYIWDSDANEWVRQTSLIETFPSGIYNQLLGSDDLVTIIQYNEPTARTTVSGIVYSSISLGTSALETFVSGVNVLTITRTV